MMKKHSDLTSRGFLRFAAGLLCVLTALPLLAGCGTAGGTSDDTTAPPEAVTETEALPVETRVEDLLGFEFEKINRNFNVLYGKGYMEPDFCADSFDGDSVSSAVYARTLDVNEKFGTELQFLPGAGTFDDRAAFLSMVDSVVQAGTNDYDMVAAMSVCLSTMVYTGNFVDLCGLETFDLDHSWWMKDTVETYGINGSVFGALGDITNSYYSSLAIVALNTNLAADYNVTGTWGDLYELVYGGNWTIDKMLEIGAACGADLDGDQKMTLGKDSFGFIARNVPSRLFMYACGVEFFHRDDDGRIVIDPTMDERALDAYNKLFAAFNTKVYANVNIEPSKDSIVKYFAQDKALMIQAYFSDLGTDVVRDMTSEYMVMPTPKYDVDQQDYIVPLATEGGMVAIPVSAADAAVSGKIIEYMGCVGQKNITPVYIEATLKTRYANDANVMNMMQYIIDRSSFTLTSMLIWNCTGLNMRNVCAFGTLNVGTASVGPVYKAHSKAWQKQIDNMLEKFYG